MSRLQMDTPKVLVKWNRDWQRNSLNIASAIGWWRFRSAVKRLQTHVYHSRGPNYVWHIDGYNKLKPKIIAGCFMDAVINTGECAAGLEQRNRNWPYGWNTAVFAFFWQPGWNRQCNLCPKHWKSADWTIVADLVKWVCPVLDGPIGEKMATSWNFSEKSLIQFCFLQTMQAFENVIICVLCK